MHYINFALKRINTAVYFTTIKAQHPESFFYDLKGSSFDGSSQILIEDNGKIYIGGV